MKMARGSRALDVIRLESKFMDGSGEWSGKLLRWNKVALKHLLREIDGEKFLSHGLGFVVSCIIEVKVLAREVSFSKALFFSLVGGEKVGILAELGQKQQSITLVQDGCLLSL